MPRHKRIKIAGAIYHVITRGIERRNIFLDDRDRQEFVTRLEICLKETGSKCYAWALMPNHFHLLIRSGAKPLSDLMRRLLTGYAVYFNRRRKRSGYLYQNRYKSVLCQEDAYLLELVRYIHLNPLRAELVNDIAGLNKHPWSGHMTLAGKRCAGWQSVDEIWQRFSTTGKEAAKKYIEFISDGIAMGRRNDLTGGGLRRSAGGWQGVRALRASKEYWRGDERMLGDSAFVNEVIKAAEEAIAHRERLKLAGWTLGKIVNKVCDNLSIEKAELLRKGRKNNVSNARMLIAYLGNKELGISGAELARALGITKQAISKLIPGGEQLANRMNLKLTN